MSSAGRILIIPRWDYDKTETYEMLDLVNYNEVSWLAKKTVVGIEPSEGEYWHPVLGLKNVMEIENIQIEQTFNFMYVEPKIGYHLVSAMVTTFVNGESDIINGICWQENQYVLFTKEAPETPTTKPVMLVWIKTT